jgi:hypothetical protein
MSRTDVKNKMKTLSQGDHSDAVLDKMASTFKALADRADFSATGATGVTAGPPLSIVQPERYESQNGDKAEVSEGIAFAGLSYSIHIHLPESRDPKVYDALFRSLREHLR